MSTQIKTTLLISTYNWKEALSLSLQSAIEQTVLPDEIVIADDGSDSRTKQIIDEFKGKTHIPIIHIWHEDKGFRKTAILNKAIAASSGEYILQIDGDVVMSRHFVEDHLEQAEKNNFVCGSRIWLDQNTTEKIIAKGLFKCNIFNMPMNCVLNSIRSRMLRHYFAYRYGKRIDHLRGCNMAFWKSDLLKVNGYNEDLLQWGHEDGEIAYRLHFAGARKKFLKMGGAVYHLYHNISSRENEDMHKKQLERVKKEHIAWCDNGIDKYLDKKANNN